MIRALATALTFALPLSATAQELRPQEQARLSNLEQSAGRGLLSALATGSSDDIAAVVRALSGTPLVALDESLAGDWNCRTIKLGGPVGLVAYQPFRCSFSLRNDGVYFEKHTGSQRTRGMIRYRNGRAVYAGVGFVSQVTPPDYAELGPEFRSDGQIQADVALFERTGPDSARLLFPDPAVESDFDILELTR
ncbi:MAG: DUF4893 domain-containing protein [Sulfitobacter sp.]|nr:DUF4893 domain-containing protein [Sulfitobacter sp.]